MKKLIILVSFSIIASILILGLVSASRINERPLPPKPQLCHERSINCLLECKPLPAPKEEPKPPRLENKPKLKPINCQQAKPKPPKSPPISPKPLPNRCKH